jgi:hypothetical protein
MRIEFKALECLYSSHPFSFISCKSSHLNNTHTEAQEKKQIREEREGHKRKGEGGII